MSKSVGLGFLCVMTLAIVACGDDGGAADTPIGPCVPGSQTQTTCPNATNPSAPCVQHDAVCPQTNTSCAMQGNVAVAVCDADGNFRRASCKCVLRGTENCGNGQLETSEQCDGVNLGGASCTTLGMGNGVLRCNASCVYDYGMCTGQPVVAGTGGGGAGG